MAGRSKKRVVIVAGAAKGIGQGVSRYLARAGRAETRKMISLSPAKLSRDLHAGF